MSSITDVAAERAPADGTSSVGAAPRSVLSDTLLVVGLTQNQANRNAGDGGAVDLEPLAREPLVPDLPADPQPAVCGNPVAADGEERVESSQPPSSPQIVSSILAERSSPATAEHAARSSGEAISSGTILAACASAASAQAAPTDLHDSSISRS